MPVHASIVRVDNINALSTSALVENVSAIGPTEELAANTVSLISAGRHELATMSFTFASGSTVYTTIRVGDTVSWLTSGPTDYTSYGEIISMRSTNQTTGTATVRLISGANPVNTDVLTSTRGGTITVNGSVSSVSAYPGYSDPSSTPDRLVWRICNVEGATIRVAFGHLPVAAAAGAGLKTATDLTTSVKYVLNGTVAYFGVRNFGERVIYNT